MSPKHSDAESPLYHIVSRDDDPAMVWLNQELLADRWDTPYYEPEVLEAESILRQGAEHGWYKLKSLEQCADWIMDFGSFALYNSIRYVEEKGIPFLRVVDMYDFGINPRGVQQIDLRSHRMMPKSMVKPGDVLLSIIGTVGIAAIAPDGIDECNSNQSLAKIRVKPEHNPYYIVAYLNSHFGRRRLNREITGSVQKHLNLGKTRSHVIPLPPRHIQDHIGNKVKQAEELRAEADCLQQEAEALLDEALGISVFLRELEEKTRESWYWVEPDEVSKRWDSEHYKPEYVLVEAHVRRSASRVKPVGNILAAPVVNGVDCRDFVDEGTPYLRVGDVSPHSISVDTAERVKLSVSEAKKGVQLRPGDVLFTRKGSFGQVAVVEERHTNCLISSEIMHLRLKSEVNPYYFAMFMNSILGFEQVERRVAGIMSYSISQPSLKTVLVPILPELTQTEIASKVSRALTNRYEAEQLLTKAKEDVERLVRGELDLGSIGVTG